MCRLSLRLRLYVGLGSGCRCRSRWWRRWLRWRRRCSWMARCRSESCRPFTTYAYADYVLAKRNTAATVGTVDKRALVALLRKYA